MHQASELSAQQSLDFAQAREDFNAGKWNAALPVFEDLHAHHPRNAEVAKFAAETALNMGDLTYAETALQSVSSDNADDWQAHALLARTYAQMSKGTDRDAELALLVKMHANTADARFRQLTQFLVERIPQADGHVDLYYSLVPWSRYNIYEMGRFFDANNKQTLRITLESGDFDQPLWAKQHPKEAAAGERMFSMDSYSEPVTANGRTTQTHATLGFFDGRPSYDTVKARMLGDHTPSSSSTVPMPQH